MANCDHAVCITFPPTYEFLVLNSSHVTINDDLNRNIPRCQLCDLVSAQPAQEEALSKENSRTVCKAEKDIKTTEEVIRRGVLAKEALEATLSQLKEALKEAIEIRDARISKPWYRYWAIWGLPEVPEFTTELVRAKDDVDVSVPAKAKPTEVTKFDEAVDDIIWEEADSIPAQATLPSPPPDTAPAG